MAEFPAMPFWTDAYLADCGHLTDAEHGRYLQLLMALWRAAGDGPRQIPNDDEWLARKFRRSVEAIRAEFRPLIDEFCCTAPKWITQKRLTMEWEYVSAMVAQRRSAANSRWEKEKGNAGASPPHMRNGRGSHMRKSIFAYAPTPTPTPTPTKEDPGKEEVETIMGTSIGDTPT